MVTFITRMIKFFNLFNIAMKLSGLRYKNRRNHFEEGNLSLKTRVGKLKLVPVNGTKTVGKHIGNLLATNRTCLYFRQLFRVGKLVFDV